MMTELQEHPLFIQTYQEWQSIVDLVARLADVRAGLIMQVSGDTIEVLVSSQNADNPYEVGHKEKLPDSGLYCERVIATQEKLLVPNALETDEWRNNPDIAKNMISYLGFPIRLSGGRPFGTLCVLDDREHVYSPDIIILLEKMRDLIESHLQLNERVLLQENARLLEQLQAELTERAQIEAELRTSREQYRMLTENMKDVVWTLDPLAGRFLYVSPSVQALRGYSAEEVMAQPMSAALTEESAQHVNNLLAQGFASFRANRRTTDSYDTSVLEQPCKDGSTVWTEVITHYVFDNVTDRVIVHGVTRDITERRRVEEALAASEERYRLLMMLSPDGIGVADRTGSMLACNEQYARMYGFARAEDVIGVSAYELVPPEVFDRLSREVAAAFARGERVARDIETEAIRRDGSFFTVEHSVAAMPWPDAPTGVAYIFSVRDITRRKELAEELERYRIHLEELVAERTAKLRDEVAERSAAQAALQRSRGLLAEAERIAGLGSLEHDLTTDELVFSDNLYRLLGISPDTSSEAVRFAALKLISPDQRHMVEAAYVRLWETGESTVGNLRVTMPSGETRIFHTEPEAICDADGKPVQIRAIVQDITQHARVEAELTERIRELSLLQELGRVVSYRFSLEDIIRLYLEKLVSLVGLDMAQVFLLQEGQLHRAGVCTGPAFPADAAVCAGNISRGDDVSLTGQPLTVAMGECLCGLAAQTGQMLYVPEIAEDARYTLDHCRACGLRSVAALPLGSGEATIGVLMVGAATQDAFGDRIDFLETAADQLSTRLQNLQLYQEVQARAAGLEETATERTLELQTERNRSQVILETVGESVVVTDLDGQMLFFNPATETLTGFSRDEMMGQFIWRPWLAQAREDSWPRAQQTISSGRPWQGEVAGLRKDGARYVVALTGTPLYDERAERQVAGVVWVQRDITALKEAERLKDQFVSTVSHELRTPISIITLSCDNLDAFYDRLDENKRRQLLGDIRGQAHQLGDLVEDILTLSRLGSGRSASTATSVALAGLVGEEVARQRPLTAERSQQLSFTVKAPSMVLGNEGQLQRVVRNLLDNAVKFTPTGGQIRCTCDVRFDERKGTPGQAWATIEVTDDGIGIPADALPLLFERFYQVNAEERAGAGLGLSIARELVALHGGWIDVTSVSGQGSTFTVYLPIVEG